MFTTFTICGIHLQCVVYKCMSNLQYAVYIYYALCTNVCQIYYMWYAFNMCTTCCTFYMYTTHCKCIPHIVKVYRIL